MPSSAATFANQVEMLKEVYTDIAEKHFDEKTLTLDVLEKGDFEAAQTKMLAEKDGNFIVLRAHTDGNPNAGIPVPERGGYPKSGSQERKRILYRTVPLVAAEALTEEIANRSDNDMKSLIRITAKEAEDLIANTRRKENRWAIGDGSSLLASSASTLTWDYSEDQFTVDDASKFKIGEQIIVRNKTTGAVLGTTNWPTTGGIADPAEITAINTTTNKLTVKNGYTGNADLDLDGSAGDLSSSGYGVYPWDSQGRAPWGLDIICSNANPSNHGFSPSSVPSENGMSRAFGAIDRATNEWWQAITSSDLSSTRPIDVFTDLVPLEAQFLERDSTPRNEYGIFVLSDYQRWNTIIQQLEVAKRTYERTRITTNKWEAVKSGMFTFGYDTQIAAGTYYFFNTDHIMRMVQKPWHFESFTGSEWNRVYQAHGRATSERERYMRKECQMLVSSCRQAHKIVNAA